MRAARGFTLMEVLVALVLLTMFALVSYRALDSVLQAQQRASAEMERWRELAVAFARVESDLSNAVRRFDARYAAVDGFHALSGPAGDAQFDLVRLLPEDAQQGVLRIGYRCKGESLSRLVWPDAADAASAPREFALLAGLQTCAFRYLDAKGTWLTGWLASGAQPLPRAVELNFVEADGTPIRRVWRVQ